MKSMTQIKPSFDCTTERHHALPLFIEREKVQEMPRMKWPVFKLEINLGNSDMNTTEDVMDALRRTANRLERTRDTEGTVFDRNGNSVGHFKTVTRREV